MSFEKAVAVADRLAESERVYYPKRVRRYAMTFPKCLSAELPVNRDTAIQFSRTLLEALALSSEEPHAGETVQLRKSVFFVLDRSAIESRTSTI
jgi:hypothetical protein